MSIRDTPASRDLPSTMGAAGTGVGDTISSMVARSTPTDARWPILVGCGCSPAPAWSYSYMRNRVPQTHRSGRHWIKYTCVRRFQLFQVHVLRSPFPTSLCAHCVLVNRMGNALYLTGHFVVDSNCTTSLSAQSITHLLSRITVRTVMPVHNEAIRSTYCTQQPGTLIVIC